MSRNATRAGYHRTDGLRPAGPTVRGSAYERFEPMGPPQTVDDVRRIIRAFIGGKVTESLWNAEIAHQHALDVKEDADGVNPQENPWLLLAIAGSRKRVAEFRLSPPLVRLMDGSRVEMSAEEAEAIDSDPTTGQKYARFSAALAAVSLRIAHAVLGIGEKRMGVSARTVHEEQLEAAMEIMGLLHLETMVEKARIRVIPADDRPRYELTEEGLRWAAQKGYRRPAGAI